MKLHRCHWGLLAAVALLGTVGTTNAHAQRFIYYSPMGPFVRNPSYAPNYYSYSSNPYGYDPYSSNPYGYNPYVAPYPAFGILPGPVLLAPWQFGNQPATQGPDRISPAPRKRDMTNPPPVPYQNVPKDDRSAEIRRVRFEINVPVENAVVLIDGAETKQTGLSRVYLTPPMDEDRLFTSAFEVRWTDEQGKAQSARKTFEFVAGETIRHTFK